MATGPFHFAARKIPSPARLINSFDGILLAIVQASLSRMTCTETVRFIFQTILPETIHHSVKDIIILFIVSNKR